MCPGTSTASVMTVLPESIIPLVTGQTGPRKQGPYSWELGQVVGNGHGQGAVHTVVVLVHSLATGHVMGLSLMAGVKLANHFLKK